MSRVHFHSYVQNDEGQPVEGVEISIYLAGTTSPATVYDNESGGSSTSVTPQATTNSEGFFEFWVPAIDEGGYALDQKFKIVWEKVGITEGYIDYYEVFPAAAPGQVDETDTDTTKNKVVSNFLAKKWTDHADSAASAAHGGMYPIDETDSDTTKDKLVSNNLGRIWTDHVSASLPSDNPHDLEPIDPFDSDSTFNKVVSNFYSKKWTDHVNSLSPSANPHNLYPVNETDTDTTKNKLVSNDLIRSIIDSISDPVTGASRYYSQTISASQWIASGSYYYYDVNHNLGVEWPVITCWDTNTKRVISPRIIESQSISTTRFFINDNTKVIRTTFSG